MEREHNPPHQPAFDGHVKIHLGNLTAVGGGYDGRCGFRVTETSLRRDLCHKRSTEKIKAARVQPRPPSFWGLHTLVSAHRVYLFPHTSGPSHLGIGPQFTPPGFLRCLHCHQLLLIKPRPRYPVDAWGRGGGVRGTDPGDLIMIYALLLMSSQGQRHPHTTSPPSLAPANIK